jgi:predicted  nucleic acid-binding Zn ribbon protein
VIRRKNERDEVIEDAKESVKTKIISGICPKCKNEFETTAELIDDYYVFNCNNCITKLRVKQ